MTKTVLTVCVLLSTALSNVALAQTPPPPTVEYYHLDAIGSVRAVTNESGQVVRRHDYFPFGEEYLAQGGNDPLRFAGKERDAETGLDYFGARYYASRTGRFTAIDPVYTLQDNLADPQRWNRYEYAKNNPQRYIDPDGRLIWVVVAVAAAAAILTPSEGTADAPGDVIGSAAAGALGELGGSHLAALAGRLWGKLFGRSAATAAKEVKLLGAGRDNLLNAAQNPKLRDAIDNLYRPGAKVGSGSSMDAYRLEEATGQLLSPTGHWQKLFDRRAQLQKLLHDPNISPSDRRITRDLLIDIQNALGGR